VLTKNDYLSETANSSLLGFTTLFASDQGDLWGRTFSLRSLVKKTFCYKNSYYDSIMLLVSGHTRHIIDSCFTFRLGQFSGGRVSVGINKIFQRWLLLLVAVGAASLVIGAADQPAGISTRNNHDSDDPMSGMTGSVSLTSSASHSVVSGMTASMASWTTNSLRSRITSSVTTSPAAATVSRQTVTHVALSPYADEIARILKFDRQVLVMVKEETHERIQRLVGYDEDGYQIIAPGIAVTVPEEKSDSILASLRRKLLPKKYLAFVIEINAGRKADKIGIIKGTDQYEILRIMHTNGDEYDISNRDIIDRLQDWEKISSFEIVGADNDWVEIEFKRLPKDLKAFSREVYEFSPDTVDEGPGTIEGLMKELNKTKRLLLLWD